MIALVVRKAKVGGYHWHGLPQVSLLSRQAYFCRDKRRILSRQTLVYRDKSKLVVTNLVATKLCLPRQKFCRDKTTSIHLSRQKTCFVTTEILEAAPANDRSGGIKRETPTGQRMNLNVISLCRDT